MLDWEVISVQDYKDSQDFAERMIHGGTDFDFDLTDEEQKRLCIDLNNLYNEYVLKEL